MRCRVAHPGAAHLAGNWTASLFRSAESLYSSLAECGGAEAHLDVVAFVQRIFVQRIDEVDITRWDELELHKDGGWNGFFLWASGRRGDDLVPVALREISYGADKTCAGTAQFVARLADCVLPNDSTLLTGADFVESPQSG